MSASHILKSITFSCKDLMICFILIFLALGCSQKNFDEPKISLDDYFIEEGFQLDVACSEPFLEAPVTMSFDNKGRIWAVEMRGYMQNLEGTGDDMPNGRITILQDLDHDGVTDHSKVFLDSLVLPRALAHVYGGLLYAEPPNLWFVDIKDDKPVNKVLVDSLYADGGNVEHQPNGLMMHIDNWIYNSKSNFRYQKSNGKWVKESTTFRGQWGITKDNFGRLYYNTNSTQLIGDYVLPNTIIKNEFYKPQEALSRSITPNQRVYPLHATAVNRGYAKGVLDKDSLLLNVTSACGPLIYRGNTFPEAYRENAFVSVPEANLVKRNIVSFNSDKVSAQQAIPNKEFLASTDHGFRPVNLFNGPDGNMYVVDMHRGIIQDKAFLTPYLHDLMAAKKLDTIKGMGRILRVSHKNNVNEVAAINLEAYNVLELVELLKGTNGWLRDRAQHLLVCRNNKTAISALMEILKDTTNHIAQIHALHTLNGMGALDFKMLETFLLSNSEGEALSHAIILLEQFSGQQYVKPFFKLLDRLIARNNAVVDLYILNSIGEWVSYSKESLFKAVFRISDRYEGHKVYQESLIAGLRGFEEEFLVHVEKSKEKTRSEDLHGILAKTISNKEKNKKNFIFTKKGVWTDSRTSGYKIFRNFCATCHGIEGGGIENLAPPLKNSEYISHSTDRLARVILHGLSGPIHVNGKLYEFNTIMPGLANNPEFSDQDIEGLVLYLNSAFFAKSVKIDIEKIKQLRSQKPKNGVYSEKELFEIAP